MVTTYITLLLHIAQKASLRSLIQNVIHFRMYYITFETATAEISRDPERYSYSVHMKPIHITFTPGQTAPVCLNRYIYAI